MLFMCFLVLTNAQLTITYESLPQPGDTFAMRYTDNPILNIGTPQSSIQHFDFTNLENDSMKFATYGITANLSFAAEYPESNLYTWGSSALYGGPGSPVPGVGWGWMFFRTDEEGMSVVGYRTGESPNIVTALQTPSLFIMKTPFTYNNMNSQNSQWSVFMNANLSDIDTVYTSFSSTDLLCDAWGTLSTPLEQNLDVIRVREFTVSVDSIYGKIANTVVWKTELKRDTVLNYLFYNPSKRHPIVSVFCRPDESFIGAEYLWYSDLHTSINSIKENKIKCYPNPTDNYIYIEGLSPKSNYDIFDLQGKKVLEGTLNEFSKINLSSLKSGVYFISLKNSKESFVKKIVIK